MTEPQAITFRSRQRLSKSHTERTLAWLREQGYKAAMVERRVPGRHITMDLFGIIDIIALTADGVMGVQSTGSDFTGHLRKITREKAQETRAWLSTPGASLLLIGWRKIDGKWDPRTTMIGLEDLGD